MLLNSPTCVVRAPIADTDSTQRVLLGPSATTQVPLEELGTISSFPDEKEAGCGTLVRRPCD